MPSRRRFALPGVAMALGAWLLPASAQQAPQPAAQPTLPLPASFTGTLPCADCPGIVHHLNLLPERTPPYATDHGRYELRLRYLGAKGGRPRVERGAWRLSGDGATLTVGSGDQRRLFRMDATGSLLTALDREGHAIASNLNYTLERANAFTSLQEAERAEQIAATGAPLEDTTWRLVTLGGQPVAVPTNGQREAHLVLHAKDARLSGSGGCNRLLGSYERNGAALRFPPIAATRLACPQGMEQENAFLQALERVAGWRIQGRRLDLTDAAGVTVAQFEAAAAK
ncbi:META domain-containing protein [Xylophilus sp.]|uniref:META domain-containing protein n=1 Tax=Xylophilus sp. TaxID=2653893 RepID=UPI0013BD48F7|nr:META domain-containing protein [Xylophilus sp.]KAF1048223.1 MAG: Lipoprotein NlpE [Xylophilus sp.]